MNSNLIWLSHLQLLDSALPVGAFSHSFGLETLVVQGEINGARDLENFLMTMLHGSWAPMDAMLVKAAYCREGAALWELDCRVDAARAARETRDGLRKMGRQLLRLSASMYPELDRQGLEEAVRHNVCPGSWPLVHGVLTHQLGVELEQAAIGYLYTCCTGAVGNAVRLSVLGQTVAQSLLAAILPELEQAWHKVAALEPEEFYSAVPRTDVAQMQHEFLPARLFMS